MVLKYKLYVFLAVFVSIFAFATKTAFASEPELTLYPASGWIEYGKDFVLDVLVDTKGQEVILVRAVLTFDPELVQIKSAERNEDSFCNWPEGEQLIDNEQGMIMATGFCQSGVDELYATVGDPGVFIRLTFETIAEGILTINWEYSGIDEPLNSVIIADGSPPQNILNVDPGSRDYIYTISTPDQPRTPETGILIFENLPLTFVVGGSVFFLAVVANILLNPDKRYFSKSRTIVVYDDKKK